MTERTVVQTTFSPSLRLKLPFLAAGFASFLFSVYLFFIEGDTTAGIFVGLWVPSIHSLGTLVLAQTEPVDSQSREEQFS
ncbi:MAG: hypothetical protein ACR2OH_05160 [Microthrixaceae bacterium]